MSYRNDQLIDLEDFQPKPPSSSDEEEVQKRGGDVDTYDGPMFGQRPSEEEVVTRKDDDDEDDNDDEDDREKFQSKSTKSTKSTKATKATKSAKAQKEEDDDEDMKKYQPKWAPSSDEEKDEPVVAPKESKRKSKVWPKSSDTEAETPLQKPQKSGYLEYGGQPSVEPWNLGGNPQTPPSTSMMIRTEDVGKKDQAIDILSPHLGWNEETEIYSEMMDNEDNNKVAGGYSPSITTMIPAPRFVKEMTELNVADKLGTPINDNRSETWSTKELTASRKKNEKSGSKKQRKNSKLLVENDKIDGRGDDKFQKKASKDKSVRMKNKKLKRETSQKKRPSQTTKSIVPVVERVPSNKAPTQIIRNVIQMDAATRRMLEEGKNAVMTKPKEKSTEEIMQYPFDQLLSVIKRKETALQKLYENYSRRKPKMKLKDIRMQEILEVMECLVTCDDDKIQYYKRLISGLDLNGVQCIQLLDENNLREIGIDSSVYRHKIADAMKTIISLCAH